MHRRSQRYRKVLEFRNVRRRTLGFKPSENMSLQHAEEIKAGSRFAFGENWSRFLTELDDDGFVKQSSRYVTCSSDKFAGERFLDIGSGSGLFSLAARRLRATVHSFDYDPQSVAAPTIETPVFLDDPDWIVEQGSVSTVII